MSIQRAPSRTRTTAPSGLLPGIFPPKASTNNLNDCHMILKILFSNKKTFKTQEDSFGFYVKYPLLMIQYLKSWRNHDNDIDHAHEKETLILPSQK
jgi:hypothetical protein